MIGKIDNELCIGCGACETVVPEAFTIENGKAVCFAENDNIEAAIAACPMGAISAVELVKEDSVEVPHKPTDEELEELFRTPTGLTLYIFYDVSSWDSRLFSEESKEVLKKNSGSLEVIYVDMDKNEEFAEGYNIEKVPTCVLVQDQKELARKSGYMDKETFCSWLKENIS